VLLPSGPEAALAVFPDIPAPKPDLRGIQTHSAARGNAVFTTLNMLDIPLPRSMLAQWLRMRPEPAGSPHRLADMPYQGDRELKCCRATFLMPVIGPSFGLAAALVLPRSYSAPHRTGW
jgi:hypothetical protein